MRIKLIAGCLLVAIASSPTGTALAQKAAVLESIDARGDESWRIALKIWEWAELGYQEKQSSALLAETLERAGFEVRRGVAGIPTAFTATIGSGRPVIAVLGEFDALPGLSQQAVPFKQPREGSANGHACGHHLFGVASMSACLALAEPIKQGKVRGTLRFYGCPAEEGGSAKAFMVRDGLFRDCDACLHWHPASRNVAGDPSCMARIAAKFRFSGKSSHAAAAPEEGRSALGAVELTDHAANILRQFTPDFTRIHNIVTAGGGAPNVIPDFCETFYYVRHPSSEVVQQVYQRLVKCAEGAALATETRLEVAYLGGTLEILPNDALARVTKANLKALNGLKYDEAELRFADQIRPTLAAPLPIASLGTIEDRSGGLNKDSTDVGDVSWVVPTTGFSAACWVPGTPMHSWQAVAAGATPIGRMGMLLAAKTLAATAWDLYQDPATVSAAKDELRRRLGDREYRSLLGPGQAPPLDYRNPPQRR